MDHRRIALAVAGIALLSAALRIPGLGRQALWIDEANCLAIAQERTASVWRALEHDCSPPLYYWLLGLTVGDDPDEARTRALSAALGVATPPLLAILGVRLLGPLGLVAGLLLAISPLHLWHSQEARMYTLVCLLGVFLAWGTVACRRGAQALLPALVACQAALLWTHHFSLFAIAVSWVIVLTGHRVSVRRAVSCILLVAVMWLPAAWLLTRQVLVFRTGTWLAPPSLDVPLRSVGLWLAGVQGADHSRVAGMPLAIILVACAAIPMAVNGLRDSTGRVLAVLCGGTLAAAWAVSRAVPALVPGRYDVVLMPSFLLVLAVGWSRLNRAGRVGTLAALTAGSALGILHYQREYQKSSVRELVALVRTLERTGDVVVVVPEVEVPVVRYYYRGERPVLVPPSFGLVDRVDYADYGARWSSDAEARELADHCWELTPAGGRILLLYSPYRATAHFKGWLMRVASYTRVARRVSGSGSVELAVLERASPAIPTELLNVRPSP